MYYGYSLILNCHVTSNSDHLLRDYTIIVPLYLIIVNKDQDNDIIYCYLIKYHKKKTVIYVVKMIILFVLIIRFSLQSKTASKNGSTL